MLVCDVTRFVSVSTTSNFTVPNTNGLTVNERVLFCNEGLNPTSKYDVETLFNSVW